MQNSDMETVLITGSGIGIGAATVRAFANRGYRVVVTDVLDDEGRRVAQEITEGGGEAEYHHLDVTSTEEVERVVSEAEGRYGPLACVVANAGIAHKVPLAELTDER